jgi:hypothetical protein
LRLFGRQRQFRESRIKRRFLTVLQVIKQLCEAAVAFWWHCQEPQRIPRLGIRGPARGGLQRLGNGRCRCWETRCPSSRWLCNMSTLRSGRAGDFLGWAGSKSTRPTTCEPLSFRSTHQTPPHSIDNRHANAHPNNNHDQNPTWKSQYGVLQDTTIDRSTSQPFPSDRPIAPNRGRHPRPPPLDVPCIEAASLVKSYDSGRMRRSRWLLLQ